MARTISWLPRLTEIRRSVKNSVRSHYTRQEIEELFGLQPSAAGRLLHLVKPVGVGSMLMVEREALATFLDRVKDAEDVPALMDATRRDKGAVSRRKLRSLKRYDLEPPQLAALPIWIRLEPGRVEIKFERPEQLAEGMLMLGGILDQDLEAFIAAYAPMQRRDEGMQERADMQRLLQELPA